MAPTLHCCRFPAPTWSVSPVDAVDAVVVFAVAAPLLSLCGQGPTLWMHLKNCAAAHVRGCHLHVLTKCLSSHFLAILADGGLKAGFFDAVTFLHDKALGVLGNDLKGYTEHPDLAVEYFKLVRVRALRWLCAPDGTVVTWCCVCCLLRV